MIVASMDIDLPVNPTIKKLGASFKILISATEALLLLEHILYIYYLMRFKEDQAKI